MGKIFIFLSLSLIILKVLAAYFTEFSLYGDEAQYWLWSQNPDLGYFSKPPLLSWFLAGYVKLFGNSFLSLKLFPILCYLLICFAFYNLCIKLKLSKKSPVPNSPLGKFLDHLKGNKKVNFSHVKDGKSVFTNQLGDK